MGVPGRCSGTGQLLVRTTAPRSTPWHRTVPWTDSRSAYGTSGSRAYADRVVPARPALVWEDTELPLPDELQLADPSEGTERTG